MLLASIEIVLNDRGSGFSVDNLLNEPGALLVKIIIIKM